MAFSFKDTSKSANKSTWLVTFTDLITLMLTFFVMICSLGAPKEEAWKKAVTGMNSYLGTEDRGTASKKALENVVTTARGLDIDEGENLGYLRSLLENQLKQSGTLEEILIREIDERLIVTMPAKLFFAKGKADLDKQGQTILSYLAVKLTAIDNRLEIYGHADSDPIATQEFPSNWELSLKRAANVAYFLGQNGYNRDIVIQGFGESRMDELPPELEPSKREQFARRIDLVIQQDKSRE